VALYAGDRPICNCGQAYYTACPGGERRTCAGCSTPGDRPHNYCEGGCSSNHLRAKEEIAEKVILALTEAKHAGGRGSDSPITE